VDHYFPVELNLLNIVNYLLKVGSIISALNEIFLSNIIIVSPNFQCEKCEKQFQSKSLLQKHLNKHGN